MSATNEPVKPPSGTPPTKPAPTPTTPPVQPPKPGAMAKKETHREEDIVHEEGPYWAAKEKPGVYHVYQTGLTHSTRVGIHSYKDNPDRAKESAIADVKRRAASHNDRAPLSKVESDGVWVREFVVPMGAGGIQRWHVPCLKNDDSDRSKIVRGRDPDTDYSREAARSLRGSCSGCGGELSDEPKKTVSVDVTDAPVHGEENQEQKVEKSESEFLRSCEVVTPTPTTRAKLLGRFAVVARVVAES